MKPKDFINCKGKLYSEHEYAFLRDEQNRRLEMAYTHGFTVATIVLVFWAAIFAFCGNLYDMTIGSESIFGRMMWIDCIVTFVIILFCSVPALIMVPFAVRYHDNIRVIINIGAYKKLFYEYPSLIKAKEETGNSDSLKVYSWELLHCNRVIPKGNWIAYEYFLIALFTVVLSVILGVVLFACIFFIPHEYHNSPVNWVIGIAFVIGAVVYIGYLIICTVRVYKHVRVNKFFEIYGDLYFNAYVAEAKAIGLITPSEARELKKIKEEGQERDKKLSDDFEKRINKIN